MQLTILLVLAAAAAVMFVIERMGVPTTLDLHFKGDVKRESRWFAQYGQSMCTPVAALLVGTMDPAAKQKPFLVIGAVVAASITCMLMKRTLGRVRPGREHAGKFLGPSWRHANYRESFPSSHSACAIACSVYIACLYPPIAWIMWGLGLTTATLRYLLDAHWPSDVLGGIAIGYASAHLWLQIAQPPPFAR